MSAIIAIAIVAILAMIVIGLAVHILFSPWLLAIVAVLLLIKFRPRFSRQ